MFEFPIGLLGATFYVPGSMRYQRECDAFAQTVDTNTAMGIVQHHPCVDTSIPR